jgi:hypothetical protein
MVAMGFPSRRSESPVLCGRTEAATYVASNLIPSALPFGRLWYEDASAAVDYAKHSSRSHYAVIRVYDEAGNVIEMHEHKGEFKEW